MTTPANYFHALRRQLRRPFRRPLVIMAPKSLLRYKDCVSPVKELEKGRFREIIDDPHPPKRPKRLVLCSGKIYYDLAAAREGMKKKTAALVRIEQLYPLHHGRMHEIIGKYRDAEEIAWVQEETKNRGAWSFMRPWLEHLAPSAKIRYIGRGYAASPATGSLERHQQEQEQIVRAALQPDPIPGDITILPEGAEDHAG